MLNRQGFTLMEMIVVLLIMGAAVALCLPSFTVPSEQAKSLNAKNNLMAIYSAQQNYLTNTNTTVYCNDTVSVNNCKDISTINTLLSLNIQDDGSYHYQCPTTATCTATRQGATALTLTVTLNAPIQPGGVNPACAGQISWCPN